MHLSAVNYHRGRTEYIVRDGDDLRVVTVRDGVRSYSTVGSDAPIERELTIEDLDCIVDAAIAEEEIES